MALEAATFISQLVASNPTGGDKKSQGDDQIRLLKAVLQATFTNADHAITFGGWEAKNAAGIISAANRTMLAADDGKAIYFDCVAASRQYDLLDIASAPAGMIVLITRDKTTIGNTLTLTASGGELINGAATLIVRAGESGILYKLNAVGNEWAFLYTRTRQDFLFALSVVLAAAGDASVFESTLASAARSPDVATYRNRNGVNNDILGSFVHRGKNTAGTQKDLARWRAKWIDVAAGSEDAQSIISTLINNVEVDAVTFGAGVFLGAATGGDPGIGKMNATEYKVNGVATANQKLQRTYDEIVGPQASTTGQIDVDDTPPLISEGEQLFSRAITPKSATSRIRISGSMNWAHESGAGQEVVFALFKDSTLIRSFRGEMISNACMVTPILYEEVSGSLTARTYSLRWGAATASLHTLNIGADGFDLGDSLASIFIIEEYLV